MSGNYFTSEDPYYCYPGTRVLKNKLGIRDHEVLVEKEGAITSVKAAMIEANPMVGSFDSNHLCAIHKELFCDVYDWAGQFRMVDIAIGIPFCHHEYIQENLDRLFMQLHSEGNFRSINNPEELASRLAYYWGELNAIHPFREGNGRTQRIFIELLALSCGWSLELSTCERSELSSASEDAIMGDYTSLKKIILRTLTRS